tara:strand:- start:127 stop:516 length:390 start_codon:yes stop_codon:yes gene_type:complete
MRPLEGLQGLCTQSPYPDAFKVASGLLAGSIEPEDIEACAQWVRACYHRPRHAELLMCALDSVLGFHGVEALRMEGEYVDAYHGDIIASHLNAGDLYAPTIILDHRDGTMHIGDIGSFIEALERERDDG